jgi:hypothetical protein
VTAVLIALAILVIVIGLFGTVLPGVPGAALVLGGLVWLAWLDDFAHIGWGTIALLVVLAAASYAVDFVATAVGTSRVGASRWAMVGAFAGTIIGLFFGLPGIVIGPFVGAVAAEYLARGTLKHATRAGFGAWLGIIIGTALKLALVFTMVGLGAAAFL